MTKRKWVDNQGKKDEKNRYAKNNKKPVKRDLYAALYAAQNRKHLLSHRFYRMNGGGGEIRTHGAVTLGGFQDRCLKPLGHLSLPCNLGPLS